MRMMKWIVVVCLLAATSGLAQTPEKIDLKDVTVTFTNISGDVYTNVSLAHGDLDGITYFDDGGGGFISYTNLSPDLLTQWGIPADRIETARQRALAKAAQDRDFWAARNAQAAALQAQYAQQLAAQQAADAAAAAAAAKNGNQGTNSPSGKKKHKSTPPANQ